jgi:hypothetical protein
MISAFQPAGPVRAALAWLPVLALVLLLCGCATDAPVRDTAEDTDRASGPTIYGQLGTSVDHVSIR